MGRVKLIILASCLLLLVGAGYVYFRAGYAHSKRLREVEPGRFYRSGQMTAAGFADAVKRFGIRTIINVQDDNTDPDINESFLGSTTVKESELCRRLGVKYVSLSPDLQPRNTPGGPRPKVIDEFLELMDREDTYPALIHCKAGLHRTGVLCALWRMEYQGWSRQAAWRELRAHGFGTWACTSANDYVRQYVLDYRPRRDRSTLAVGVKD